MSSSNVSSVVKHFPQANEGFITTLGSTILSGATEVPLTTTSGLTNGTVFVGIIEPGTVGKEQTFTGTVDTSGNQITGVKWTRGANTGHNAGVTIVDYVSGTGQNMMTKGLLVAHDQDGTLKDDVALTTNAATLTLPKVVTGINDTNNNELLRVTATGSAVNEVTLANAATGNNPSFTASGGDTNIGINLVPKGTGEIQFAGIPVSGAWQTWTPTFSNWTIGTGGSAGTVARYKQVGKTVHFYIKSTLGTSGQSVGSNPTFTLPVTSIAYDTDYVMAWGRLKPVNDVLGTGTWATTTTCTLTRFDANNDSNTVSSTTPGIWAAGGLFVLQGFYEAA